MSQPPRLLVASHNRAKAHEIARILTEEGLSFEVLSLADRPDIALPPETGTTFADNAVQKARHAARAAHLPAVADDSGLEVEALDGEPGIRSARYAGDDATDEQRYRKILDLLRDVPDERRQARFVCAAAYAAPDGASLLAEGTCEGRIARAPAGAGGFGYDPIFIPEGHVVTMAQLTPEQKDALSHRGRAFRLLARLIGDHLASHPAR